MFETLEIGRMREVSDLDTLNGLLAERMKWMSKTGWQESPRHELLETLRRGETAVYLVGERVRIPFFERGDERERQAMLASRVEGAGTRSGSAECQCPQPTGEL
jgi:hypothetical protein